VQGVVLVAWIFFRSESLSAGLAFVDNLLTLDFRPLPRVALAGALFLVPLAGLHALAWLREVGLRRPLGPIGRTALVGAMLYTIATLHTEASDFIYFQF